MVVRVRRRFRDAPAALVAAIKLARLAELERKAPLEEDPQGRVFWDGLFSEDDESRREFDDYIPAH